MIIFGLSVFYIFGLKGTGRFACPQCGGDRAYEHRVGRRFFTLFFLPVIPLDKVGEVVRCQACRTRFDPAVLRRPTNTELAGALSAGARAATAVMLHAGGGSEAAVHAAVEVVRAMGTPEFDAPHVHADLSRPVDSSAEPLRTVAAHLAPEARERVLAGAVRVGLADGPLAQPERDALAWIGGNLGMTPAHTHGVVSMIESAAAR